MYDVINAVMALVMVVLAVGVPVAFAIWGFVDGE